MIAAGENSRDKRVRINDPRLAAAEIVERLRAK